MFNNEVKDLTDLGQEAVDDIFSIIMSTRGNSVKVILGKYNVSPLALRNFMSGIACHQRSITRLLSKIGLEQMGPAN